MRLWTREVSYTFLSLHHDIITNCMVKCLVGWMDGWVGRCISGRLVWNVNFRAKDEINSRKKLKTSKVGYLRRAVWGSFTQRSKSTIWSPSSGLELEIRNHFEHFKYSKIFTLCLTDTTSRDSAPESVRLESHWVSIILWHNNSCW